MKRKDAIMATLAALTIASAGSFSRLSAVDIRAVDFLSIFAIGALTGMLICIFAVLRESAIRK